MELLLLFLFVILISTIILYYKKNTVKHFNDDDIIYAVKRLNIKFDGFSFYDLKYGTNLELEHGTCCPKTNVTDDDLLTTVKIALAHLCKFPSCYS